MSISTPQEIGLPEKFTSWRPVQIDALETLKSCDKRFVALCAPTGSGKSGVVVADALDSGEPTCIVTASRGLQDQYLDDFQSIGMVDLRGKANYNCGMNPEYSCQEGHAGNCPYKGTIACPASQAEMRAAVSSLVVTNYAKWTMSKKFGTGMSHFKRVVFDEAHNAVGAIAQAMQVILSHKEIEEKLKVDFLSGADALDMNKWKDWAALVKGIADTELLKAQAKITGVNDPKPAWVRHYTHMRNLCRRLAILKLARATDWVVEELNDGFQFDPIRLGRYAESTLFLGTPKVVMLSATLRPKTMYMCGVPTNNFLFKEFPSDFDPKRCPIYYIPTMRVDSEAGDLGLLWAKLDQIASKRRDHKGIVNTVSFVRQREVVERSRFSSSMIINPKGEPAAATVDLFKEAGPGTILVSPSVGEGYDFPHDYCRWLFMAKIPFEPPSKILKAREHDDPEYRAYQAIQGLVQFFGRGMRERSDWCEGFIGDQHLDWFLPRYGHLAPHNFHNNFKIARTVPPPLNLAA